MGLKPQIKLEVLKMRPTLLSDAEQIAKRMDSAIYQAKFGHVRPRSVPFVPRQSTNYKGPVPMDIDAVEQVRQNPGASRQPPSL